MLVDTSFLHQKSVYKHLLKADKKRQNNNKPEWKEVDEDCYTSEQDESTQEMEESVQEMEKSMQKIEESMQEMEESVQEIEGAQETEKEISQEEMNRHEVRENT